MVKQFVCEGCGAKLQFDADTQKLKCDYCGSDKVVMVDYEVPEEHDLFSAPKHTGWDTEVKTAVCDSCGAKLTSGRLAGFCPFCSSAYVRELVPDPELIRPENLIPFQISKKKVMRIFKRWIGKGWFRPSKLKKMHKLDAMHGVYLPFWTYDCAAHSDWSAMSGYYYYVTRTFRTKQGTRTVRERKVRWVPSSGSRNGIYDDVLIPATKGLDLELLYYIYPFNLEFLVPYKPEFLTGWLAEDYAVPLPEGWLTAKGQVESSERGKCASAVPGDTHRALRVNTVLSKLTYKHILLPVWVAAYDYNKKTYHFLVNGQTGELQGEAPISWLKVAAVILVVAATVIGIYFFTR